MISQDREIELALIGSLLLWYEDLREKTDELAEEDFYFFPELFLAIQREHRQGTKMLDFGLLASRISDPALRDAARASLDYAVSFHAVDGYMARIKELSTQRRLSEKMQNILFGGDIQLHDLQAIIDGEAGMQAAYGAKGKALSNMDEFIAHVGERQERILTGFSTTDAVLGGLRKPSVCYIGARPSTGKTALALNIARNQDTAKTLIFSLEMDASMIFERLACTELDIDYRAFTKQSLSGVQIQGVKEAALQWRKKETVLVLDDVYSIEGITAAVSSVKPDLVIIDYIQKVTTAQRLLTTRERIEHISGELKRIAKYNGCCVICLSQVSRDGKNEPTMSSLKEAGGLEADGDYVLMLHRPYVQNKNDPDILPETTVLLIDKNKFGSTGAIDLRFDGAHQRFVEVDFDREGEIL